jgi:hypothetical protein
MAVGAMLAPLPWPRLQRRVAKGRGKRAKTLVASEDDQGSAVALGDGRGLSLVAGGEDQSSAVALGDGRGRRNGVRPGGSQVLSAEKDLYPCASAAVPILWLGKFVFNLNRSESEL